MAYMLRVVRVSLDGTPGTLRLTTLYQEVLLLPAVQRRVYPKSLGLEERQAAGVELHTQYTFFLADTYLERTTESLGGAVDFRKQLKRAKYDALESQYLFSPIDSETLGS